METFVGGVSEIVFFSLWSTELSDKIQDCGLVFHLD